MPFFVLEMNKNRVLPQKNLEKGQLLPVIQNFLAHSKKKRIEYFVTRTCEFVKKNVFPAIFDSSL